MPVARLWGFEKLRFQGFQGFLGCRVARVGARKRKWELRAIAWVGAPGSGMVAARSNGAADPPNLARGGHNGVSGMVPAHATNRPPRAVL